MAARGLLVAVLVLSVADLGVSAGGAAGGGGDCHWWKIEMPEKFTEGGCCFTLANKNLTGMIVEPDEAPASTSVGKVNQTCETTSGNCVGAAGTRAHMTVEKCASSLSFLQQMGLLFGLNALVCIVLYFMGQPTLVAFIIVGMIVKAAVGESADDPEAIAVLGHFSEVGILMLLFMAGIETDVAAFIKRWEVVSIMAIGQIIVNTALGAVAAAAMGVVVWDTSSPAVGGDGALPSHYNAAFATICFGLCLTFSSTIVVLAMLKRTKQLGTLHGQICMGQLVIQDIVAVSCLAILESVNPNNKAHAAGGVGIGLLKLLGLFIAFLTQEKMIEASKRPASTQVSGSRMSA